MRIAVINETSTGDRNWAVLSALEGFGHEIINAGMTQRGTPPELNYVHTAFIAASLLNLNRVDAVAGGCGTGQGFAIAANQYPNVFCGIIANPLDAWLFNRINAGNCVSLVLNQRYGLGSEIELKLIMQQLFSGVPGEGYPEHRREAQKVARLALHELSGATHLSFARIVERLPEHVVRSALDFAGIRELLDIDAIEDAEVKIAFQRRLL